MDLKVAVRQVLEVAEMKNVERTVYPGKGGVEVGRDGGGAVSPLAPFGSSALHKAVLLIVTCRNLKKYCSSSRSPKKTGLEVVSRIYLWNSCTCRRQPKAVT